MFLLRLFLVQIVRHNEYEAEALGARTKQYELIAKRGEVFMRDGKDGAIVPVIMNERTWTIFIDPSFVKDQKMVEEKLGEVLAGKMRTDWSKVWQNPKNMYVEVAKDVDYKTVTKVKQLNLRGVGQKETAKRVYPAGDLAAAVLGFVNAEGVGAGVEGALDGRLKGENGLLKTVTDVNAIPLSIGENNVDIPAKNGENIVLSLDDNVQRKTEQVLSEAIKKGKGKIRSASAIIMNPNNGQVMAMANVPGFNPEKYYAVKDAAYFQNRVTGAPYEPASVCKTFTYAAAIDKGSIRPEDSYKNTGSTRVDDREIKNAYGTENKTGILSFQKALNYSLNTGSVEVMRRMGGGEISPKVRETIYDYFYNRFGLGRKTGVELYEESGKIYSAKEAEGNAVRYANMSFGQGLNITMLQVAAGFSAMINGGNYYRPTVIAGTEEGNKLKEVIKAEPVRQGVIKASTSETMRKMLAEVRYEAGGKTADRAGFLIGAKTGTAETLDANGHYTSQKTVASVLGFGGEKEKLPQYVIMLRLDGDALLWGSLDGLPVFTSLSNYMLGYLNLRPAQ